MMEFLHRKVIAVPAKKKARVVILEGSWMRDHEAPKILPYFQAVERTYAAKIDIEHRTIKDLDDIAHYAKKLERNAGVMLYFACHGDNGELVPADGTYIAMEDVAAALGSAPTGAIDFVHFGCCEMVVHGQRRAHDLIMQKSGALWVSGYTQSVDWLPSTFLDLLLTMQIFVPQYAKKDGRAKQILPNAKKFFEDNDQMARNLGLSALVQGSTETRLLPKALHQPK
jgi:hypothetical protein